VYRNPVMGEDTRMGEEGEGDAGLICHRPMFCKINFEPMCWSTRIDVAREFRLN
jgi:hypothetical protein